MQRADRYHPYPTQVSQRRGQVGASSSFPSGLSWSSVPLSGALLCLLAVLVTCLTMMWLRPSLTRSSSHAFSQQFPPVTPSAPSHVLSQQCPPRNAGCVELVGTQEAGKSVVRTSVLDALLAGMRADSAASAAAAWGQTQPVEGGSVEARALLQLLPGPGYAQLLGAMAQGFRDALLSLYSQVARGAAQSSRLHCLLDAHYAVESRLVAAEERVTLLSLRLQDALETVSQTQTLVQVHRADAGSRLALYRAQLERELRDVLARRAQLELSVSRGERQSAQSNELTGVFGMLSWNVRDNRDRNREHYAEHARAQLQEREATLRRLLVQPLELTFPDVSERRRQLLLDVESEAEREREIRQAAAAGGGRHAPVDGRVRRRARCHSRGLPDRRHRAPRGAHGHGAARTHRTIDTDVRGQQPWPAEASIAALRLPRLVLEAMCRRASGSCRSLLLLVANWRWAATSCQWADDVAWPV